MDYTPVLTRGDAGSEVKYIWPTWRTFGSIVFLINRYFAFVANVVITAMQDVPRDRFVRPLPVFPP